MGFSKISKETFTIPTCALSSATQTSASPSNLSTRNGMICGAMIILPTIKASGAASATVGFYQDDDKLWWSITLTASSAALTYPQSALSLPIQDGDYWTLSWSEETSSAWSSATSAEAAFTTTIYTYVDA